MELSARTGGAAAVGEAFLTPHFDRLVIRAGDDGLAVRREGDGRDVVAVGILLGRLELQCTCKTCEKGVRGEERWHGKR